MANQRSKKRNAIVGAYITPELKKQISEVAKKKGITLTDLIRELIIDSTKKENK